MRANLSAGSRHCQSTFFILLNDTPLLNSVLDVAFDEDACRIRKDRAPQNFSLLRHIALNLLGQDETTKAGIAAKRKKAGWDDDYLLNILSQ
jgi:hypothetical protein